MKSLLQATPQCSHRSDRNAIPGLEAVEKHRRLMVLGKPGAGKTTFLRYLAMQCITDEFAADKVPFFVILKDFSEMEKSPSLLNYLAAQLPNSQNTRFKRAFKRIAPAMIVERLLSEGQGLILLDGLDEVQEEHTKHVIGEIRDTADQFCKSQFVVTCRIAAKEYTFEQFTEVEVADFNEQQIATFANNWFRAKDDSAKAKIFLERLKENEPIQELASSPLLLTLLCIVFGDCNNFSSNRSILYEEGVKVLLKKWDAKRNIERDEVYKELDVQRRVDLLSYVALLTFQQAEYFIKQQRIEGYIADFIGNLHNIDPGPEQLRIDSEIVLRAIQAQHGFLVERARNMYSFSHLTFQEYFTAREIYTTNQIDFLAAQIGEKRWREVFLLTVVMMRDADKLITAMKLNIDSFLTQDAKLQQFLQWVYRKSSSVKASYRPAVVRAFYLALALDLDLALDTKLASALDVTLALDVARAQERSPERAQARTLHLDRALSLLLSLARARAHALRLDLALARDLAIELANARNCALYLAQPELNHQLENVFNRLPDTSNDNRENFKKWWETNGEKWTQDLREITVTQRNIGHDWQFTDEQKALLQQYYDANLLLIECLNSGCYVNRSVREEIEQTLLLPVEVSDRRSHITAAIIAPSSSIVGDE